MAGEMRNDAARVHPWQDAAPSAWILDATQSTFAFRVKHFWGLMTVQGQFKQFEGQTPPARPPRPCASTLHRSTRSSDSEISICGPLISSASSSTPRSRLPPGRSRP
jgi:hypothetical protein